MYNRKLKANMCYIYNLKTYPCLGIYFGMLRKIMIQDIGVT